MNLKDILYVVVSNSLKAMDIKQILYKIINQNTF
jgi:hypothetical protein